MANRRFQQFYYSLVHKPTAIIGVASLNASGAILSQDIQGATLTKTGTGAYTLTLQDKYFTLLSPGCHIAETAQDLTVKPGLADVAGAKTIVFNTKTAGVNTDPTATCKLYFNIVLRNSTVVK